jgi:hypothetical protein
MDGLRGRVPNWEMKSAAEWVPCRAELPGAFDSVAIEHNIVAHDW